MIARLLTGAVAVLITSAVVLLGTGQAAQPGASLAKPSAPGTSGAVQVGAYSSLAGLVTVNRAEMQLKHEAVITPPATANSAYSFSLVGKTSNGWFLRMGYMVLQSDGGGLARFFMQVLKPNTSGGYAEVYWNLSRAGAANPPPASSCSSGDDTCNGYPFSFVLSAPDTVTFYFDWISKAKVRSGAGTNFTDVYFLGELSGAAPGDRMGPRSALTTYRVWNGGPAWIEPSPATAFGAAPCPPFGVAYAGRSPSARRDGVHYHSTAAGSGSACTAGGTTLWTANTP